MNRKTAEIALARIAAPESSSAMPRSWSSEGMVRNRGQRQEQFVESEKLGCAD